MTPGRNRKQYGTESTAGSTLPHERACDIHDTGGEGFDTQIITVFLSHSNAPAVPTPYSEASLCLWLAWFYYLICFFLCYPNAQGEAGLGRSLTLPLTLPVWVHAGSKTDTSPESRAMWTHLRADLLGGVPWAVGADVVSIFKMLNF